MEKLIHKFIEIGQNQSSSGLTLNAYNTAFYSAEECKKVACDFAWYMINGHQDASKTWNELFNEYLKDFYDSTQ
jgi:hypothetical protein